MGPIQEIQQHILKKPSEDSFYFYSKKNLREKLKSLNTGNNNIDIYYTVKANPYNKILKEVKEEKNIYGFEFSSLGEMKQLLKIDKNLKRGIFTSPGKTENELKFALEHKVGLIVVESLMELQSLQEICKQKKITQDILLRTHIHTKHSVKEMSLSDGTNKFGFYEKELDHALKNASKFSKLKIVGMHCYPISGVISKDELLGVIKESISHIQLLEDRYKTNFSIINLGGGIGVDYEGERVFPYQEFMHECSKYLEDIGWNDKKIIFELGRHIVADCGYFVTKVINIKQGNNGKICITAAGINGNLQIREVKMNYHFSIIRGNTSIKSPFISKNNTFDVYGPLLLPIDKLLSKQSGREIYVGDYLVFKNFGAYGKNLSIPNFGLHSTIKEYMK